MRAVKRILTTIGALILLAGCESPPTETVSRCLPEGTDCEAFLGASVEPSLELGAEVYRRSCLGCHGSDGKGAGNVDRGNFADPGWHRRWSDSELMGIVTAGRGTRMPGFRLPTRELKSVVVYIRGMDEARGKADKAIPKKEGMGPVMPENY